ncbi:MAG: hypothetical protein NWE98_10255 [Candidatus Bathyarchaeota archaeon]|nr:hypothetical protein [Candidatus Bathyarchaeota archaeon]
MMIWYVSDFISGLRKVSFLATFGDNLPFVSVIMLVGILETGLAMGFSSAYK